MKRINGNGEVTAPASGSSGTSVAIQSATQSNAGVVRTLGLTLSGITTDLKEKFSLADGSKGVVVVDVAKDSPGAVKGMRPGDLIMEAAQEEVKSPGEVSSKIEEAKQSGRKSILLLVERQGDLRFIALRLYQG